MSVPRVLVVIPASLRAYWGGAAKHETEAATLADAMRSLGTLSDRVLDDTGALRKHIHLFVNSAHAPLERPLAEGDVIHILPAVSGG